MVQKDRLPTRVQTCVWAPWPHTQQQPEMITCKEASQGAFLATLVMNHSPAAAPRLCLAIHGFAVALISAVLAEVQGVLR